MDQDRVHRDTLYAEVWATPMLSLAPKYGVSAVFLSRVCARLKVPCPPRGYWARKKSGQKLSIPPLPKLRVGDAAEWRKGDQLLRSKGAAPVDAALKGRSNSRLMVMGSLEPFTSGRVAGDGYLKPMKRNLPDLVVTEPTLHRAATILQKIATRFRDQKHRISVACGETGFTRKALTDEQGRLKRSIFETNTIWSPGRPTVVFIGEVAIGLTIYEQTVEKEMVYIDGQSLPVHEARILNPGLWDRRTKTTYTKSVLPAPSGRLCLKAYSPYYRVEWAQTWTEDDLRLSKQIDEIASSLIATASDLKVLVSEENKKAEEEHEQWQVARAIFQAEQQRSVIEKARQESLKSLLKIIDRWSESKKVDDFFDDIIARSASLTERERSEILAKVKDARELIDSPDSTEALRLWDSPPPLPSE